ncbi:MAG: hypothetical protein ACSHWP_00980 [Pseudoalteromonas sp.]
MKLKNISILFILALTVFTGTVNATTNATTDLVTDKAITMQLIKESLSHDSLVIDKADFEDGVKILLAQKPYMPKTRFFARSSDIRSATALESEE